MKLLWNRRFECVEILLKIHCVALPGHRPGSWRSGGIETSLSCRTVYTTVPVLCGRFLSNHRGSLYLTNLSAITMRLFFLELFLNKSFNTRR